MRSLLLAATAVLVAACSGPPSIAVGPDPADPAAPVRATRYAPVFAGEVDYRPVEPRSWIEQNRAATPGQGGR
ncbi:hypothetical protein ABLE93_02680 [Xanthobacter sp. KR7-65]|uniref:hypothetical protein n=1 Tax=Xanthobacter sp. KR7-65 TaxID=3156612 RepID=UPI0032B38519